MTDKESIKYLIDVCIKLQRIKNSGYSDERIDDQMKNAKLMLKSFGIILDDIELL